MQLPLLKRKCFSQFRVCTVFFDETESMFNRKTHVCEETFLCQFEAALQMVKAHSKGLFENGEATVKDCSLNPEAGKQLLFKIEHGWAAYARPSLRCFQ